MKPIMPTASMTSTSLLKGVLTLGLLLCGAAIAQDAPQPATLNDYILAGGDVIDVRVYGEEDLSLTLSVPTSGTVAYAFVGNIELAGKTVDQVQQEIHQRLLEDYLLEPRVAVSIVRYRDFYINGSIARSGNYPWEPGLTVRRAISMAGGLRERASTSKWYLVPEGGTEESRRRVNEDDAVMPGDTLIIEESFF